MAVYVEIIPTPLSPERAFAYMANLDNFPKWDPGTKSSVHVSGEGANAIYDLTVSGPGRPIVLRYHYATYDPPREFAIEAVTRSLRTVDTITITPQGSGSSVRYEATLRTRGWLAFLNPFLGPMFHRIAKRGGVGLRKALAAEAAA
jgi:hypothetical protein